MWVEDTKSSDSKTLFDNYYYGNLVTDHWTPFTELDITRNPTINIDFTGGWGWKIDKIKAILER
jgi:hypothetical protein